jgi:hypothetical protein
LSWSRKSRSTPRGEPIQAGWRNSAARDILPQMASHPISFRLLLASVVLPALVVVADQMLLGLAEQHRWSVPTRLAVMGWFVVQTAMVQTVSTCMLAALLHISGYRIELQESNAEEESVGPVQFSIRHLLIATTAVAIMVPIVQGMLQQSTRFLSGRQWLHSAADGVVLAVVSLAAFWAALGAGRWWTKTSAFAMLALAAGASLCWLEKSIVYPLTWSATWKQSLTDAGWWWVAWTMLAGSFLAGMLLVLCATGYRLLRRRR